VRRTPDRRGAAVLLGPGAGYGRHWGLHSELEGNRGFFLSPDGAIWSRIVSLGPGLGPVYELTTAQIIFSGLAGMEDAQVKSGNGLTDRSKTEEKMQGMSVAEYAKIRQASQHGNEICETRKVIKEKQKPLRALLEGRIKKLVLEDMRNQ
jgi:hypothetical protein